VYKTLGAKKRAAELYERNAAKGNCASLVDAAELYEEMGDIRRAAMLYEKHGAYPGKVAEFYEQLGEFRKAAVIYEHFSSTHKKSASIYRQLNDTAAIEKLWEKRCEQLSFIDLIDEAAKEYDTEGRVARAALLQNINKLINIQSVEKIFPEIAGEIKSTVEYIDDMCKNESNKRKIIKMATCGTNFYSVERDSGVTDNFGCSDVETYHYLDLEVKGLKPEAIFISGIYLLARNDWKDLAIPERATAYQNIHNIWQYKEAGGRLEVLIKDNAR